MSEEFLSFEDAYKASFNFIRDYYIRDGRSSQDLESLLSGMALTGSGKSSDPAFVEFFRDAVKAMRREKEQGL